MRAWLEKRAEQYVAKHYRRVAIDREAFDVLMGALRRLSESLERLPADQDVYRCCQELAAALDYVGAKDVTLVK